MDFFGRQDLSRRKTKILLVYFGLAVVLIVLSINLVFASISFDMAAGSHVIFQSPLRPEYWQSVQCLIVSLATIGVIMLGNLLVYFEIRGGGAAVAEYAGASRVDFSSNDPLIKRYINVVEEMSIASGVVMPMLFVQKNEQGINAFVAGIRPENTAMVVTQGALEKLNRDELQAVAGHEFSHVFHGDMRLNVRLIGIIYGITMIGEFGRVIVRGISQTRHRSSNRERGGGIVVVALVVGAALFCIGYIGLFFGRLIRASVSRQREFLADASSVQYTRNKQGIASALTTILYDSAGSHLTSKKAEDIAHMCFGESVALRGLFATHPPLKERINVISPGFLAQYKINKRKLLNTEADTVSQQPDNSYISSFTTAGSDNTLTDSKRLVESVGEPQPEHLDLARSLLNVIPDALHLAAYHSEGARALIYAMILAANNNRVPEYFRQIETQDSAENARLTESYCQEFIASSPAIRLPLIELCVPLLRELSDEEKNKFNRLCIRLSALDKKTSLFEFVIITIIQASLTDVYKNAKNIEYRSVKQVESSLSRVLSVLIQAGRNAEPEELYKRLMSRFKHTELTIIPLSDCKVSQLSTDLAELSRLRPAIRRNILEAFVDSILVDEKVLPIEAELLRAICMVIDCPMPPVISVSVV